MQRAPGCAGPGPPGSPAPPRAPSLAPLTGCRRRARSASPPGHRTPPWQDMHQRRNKPTMRRHTMTACTTHMTGLLQLQSCSCAAADLPQGDPAAHLLRCSMALTFAAASFSLRSISMSTTSQRVKRHLRTAHRAPCGHAAVWTRGSGRMGAQACSTCTDRHDRRALHDK